MKHRLIIAASLIALMSTGCATTPDPAEVCSAEWIKPRADRAVDRIADRTKPAIKSLRKAGESWAKGKEPSLFKMMSLNRSVKKLVSELEDGRGINDLKTLSSTCNDPKIISTAMSGFLRDQGLSDKMANFIESMGFYRQAIEGAMTRDNT